MRTFTERCQRVEVYTLSTLRKYLKTLSQAESKFDIGKLHRDHVTIRRVDISGGKSEVVLPVYPTGHTEDTPGNPNVVLDPIGFVNINTPEERNAYLPLLGSEVLAHYERLHVGEEMSLARCC